MKAPARHCLLCVLMLVAWCGRAQAATAADRAPAGDSVAVAAIDLNLGALPSDSASFEQAAQLLLDLLGRAGEPLPDPEAQILRRHVARILPLMPDSLSRRIAPDARRGASDRWNVAPGSGNLLLMWWRSHDPIPATARNERVEEHLRRVAFALKEFPAETLTGYDDRGTVYVRLGEPYIRRSIDFNDGRLVRDVFRFGVPVTASDFPDNEVWTYPHIHSNIYYIFVKRHKVYQIGSSGDLLPRPLQVQTSLSPRSMNIATSSLAAMRYILSHLALLHSDFGSRFAAIDNYAMWQEERRMSRVAGAPLAPGEIEQVVGSGGTAVAVYSNPHLSILPINEFVRTSLTENRMLELGARHAREEVAPEIHSHVLNDAEIDAIPIAVRTSRFLSDDGSTRTLVDWAPLPGALDMDERMQQNLEDRGLDQYHDAILQVTMMQEDAAFARSTIEQDTFALIAPSMDQSVIPPQTARMTIGGSGSRLAVQLDRYVAHVREGPPMRVLRGPHVQLGLARAELLPPLDGTGRRLEMSDLRPLFTLYTAAALAASAEPLANAEPFPFTFPPSQGSLILQFEIYNLTFGADDRTRYSIEYEVAREDPERGIRGILGRRRLERTAARTEHESRSRAVDEYIVLDPGEWSHDSELILTVRVTDQVAERSVERSLAFRP